MELQTNVMNYGGDGVVRKPAEKPAKKEEHAVAPASARMTLTRRMATSMASRISPQ